jgi:hypothetical protein
VVPVTEQLSFYDLTVVHEAEGRPVIHTDTTRGHISIWDAEGFALGCTDVDPGLDVWAVRGVHLTPALARQLGAALTAWADRKETR